MEPSLTITELLDALTTLFDEFLPTVVFAGEITECKVAGSGHVYVTIKDDDVGAQASVSCVLWRTVVSRLAMKPAVGLKVVCTGRPVLYKARGQFQIELRHMALAGDGILKRKFEEMRQKLAAEGLFDESRKRSLPYLPKMVGVVTSASGAVMHDIAVTVERRMPSVSLVVVDVRVQGIGAAREVARGIAQLNENPEIDVIIVARGGGSLEDLWAFNEEEVVRAVFASKKPIVSAIGHEVDVTLCDYAADVRAPTPTGAAELVVPDRNELLRSLLQQEKRLVHADRWMRDRCRAVDDTEMALQSALRRRFDGARNQLAVMQSLVQSLEPTRRLSHARGILDQIAGRHHQAIITRIKQEQLKLDRLVSVRDATSPVRVLERGYAIVRGSHGVIDRASAIPTEGSVSLQFQDGNVAVERYRDRLSTAAN